MLFSVIIFTKLKLHTRNEIIRVLLKFQREVHCIMFLYRMGLGKTVLIRAVLNIQRMIICNDSSGHSLVLDAISTKSTETLCANL